MELLTHQKSLKPEALAPHAIAPSDRMGITNCVNYQSDRLERSDGENEG